MICNDNRNNSYLFQPLDHRLLLKLYYWLIGKQKTALSWWTKSIKTGESIGAGPDLARTYFEIGKRLNTPQSKYKQFNDITVRKYLDKAKIMFEDMDLQWDLNELGKIAIQNQ